MVFQILQKTHGSKTKSQKSDTDKSDKAQNGTTEGTPSTSQESFSEPNGTFTEDLVDEKINEDQVFRPQNSVTRTPPFSTNMEINCEDIINGKRVRSADSTPDTNTTIKRPCNVMITGFEKEVNLSKQKDDAKVQQLPTTELVITEVFSHLEKMQQIMNKGERGFQKEDQESMQNVSFSIHKCLTLLVHKIGVLQQENLELK